MEDTSDDLTVGVLAGIVFGGVIGLIVLFILLICICNACRKKLAEDDDSQQRSKPSRSQPENSNGSGERHQGCVNRGFVMGPSAPPHDIGDNDEAPPSYQDVITGNI